MKIYGIEDKITQSIQQPSLRPFIGKGTSVVVRPLTWYLTVILLQSHATNLQGALILGISLSYLPLETQWGSEAPEATLACLDCHPESLVPDMDSTGLWVAMKWQLLHSCVEEL